MKPNTTNTTAVVIVPPEHVWPRIQEIRRLYDRKFNRWMPHITLLYPFRRESELGSATPILQRTSATLSPFAITLAHFRWFSHGRGRFTVWLEAEPRPALVDLQSRLQMAFPDCDNTARHAAGFSPHLSVGQVDSRSSLDRLVASLTAAWRPFVFVATEVALLRRNEDTPFEVAALFPFGP